MRLILRFLAKQLAILNNMYDNMQAPMRFTTMITILLIPLFAADLLVWATGHSGWEISTWILILLIIIVRHWWVYGNLKTYLSTNQVG